jgi:hypothetical protein
MKSIVREDTARVVALAVATWAVAVAGAAFEGAFQLFGSRSIAYFAAAMCVYAAAAYLVDSELRAFARSVPAAWMAGVSAALGAALAITLCVPAVPLAVFLAPLATASVLGFAEAIARGAPRSSGATRPGERQAASEARHTNAPGAGAARARPEG